MKKQIVWGWYLIGVRAWRRLGPILVLLWAMVPRVQAHRLDEYLQAALVGITRDSLNLQLSLTPGAAVASNVLEVLDADHDGRVVAAEQDAYAARVLSEVSMDVDGRPVTLVLQSSHFPLVGAMKEGFGLIELEARAHLPELPAGDHVLHLQNRHLTNISVYLANALVPDTTEVLIQKQRRDLRQTELFIDYTLVPTAARTPLSTTLEIPDQKGSSVARRYLPAILMITGLFIVGLWARRARGGSQRDMSVPGKGKPDGTGAFSRQGKWGAVNFAFRFKVGGPRDRSGGGQQ
ncbi:MAG TPA: hypothetical protein VMF06_03940 [Candidatus Limnocylindria bacterium]|jgi:hypothetical protein|nr:hypothetical protein [Candidatus Limnocylindria bacterium]